MEGCWAGSPVSAHLSLLPRPLLQGRHGETINKRADQLRPWPALTSMSTCVPEHVCAFASVMVCAGEARVCTASQHLEQLPACGRRSVSVERVTGWGPALCGPSPWAVPGVLGVMHASYKLSVILLGGVATAPLGVFVGGQDMPKLLGLVAGPLSRVAKVGGQGRGTSRAGAICTPYTGSPHLQRLVQGPLVLPPVYAGHAARCNFMKPSSVWKVLFKIFPSSLSPSR